MNMQGGSNDREVGQTGLASVIQWPKCAIRWDNNKT